MSIKSKDFKMKYAKHLCQHCGSDRKLVETIIFDEFVYNEDSKQYEPMGFLDDFDHSGVEICGQCEKDWTGITD